MKLFEMPKAELVKFNIVDVITTSCDDDCYDDDFLPVAGSGNCW